MPYRSTRLRSFRKIRSISVVECIVINRANISITYIPTFRSSFYSQHADAASGLVDTLDQVFMLLRLEAQSIAEANPQVRMLDFYTLSAVSSDQEEGMNSTRGIPPEAARVVSP